MDSKAGGHEGVSEANFVPEASQPVYKGPRLHDILRQDTC